MHPIQPMDGPQYGPEQINPEGIPLSVHPDDEPPVTLDTEGRPMSQYGGSHAGPPSTIFERTPSIHHSQGPFDTPFGATPANSLAYSPTMESVISGHPRSRSRSRSRLAGRFPFRRQRGGYSDDDGDIVLMVDDNADIQVRQHILLCLFTSKTGII